MLPNALPSEMIAIVGVIDPDALTVGTHDSDWADLSAFGQIMAIAETGTMGVSSTFDAKLQQATNAAGAGAKDIAGKAITQIVQGGGGSDEQAIINVRAEELDLDGGFTHVRLRITIGAANSDGAGLLLGVFPRYAPASDSDLSSVTQIVA